MNAIPHIVEAALLLLVTFLIGCIIGWFLRAKIFRGRRSAPLAQKASSVATSQSSSVTKPTVSAVPDPPKPTPVEKAATPADSAPNPAVNAPENTKSKTPKKSSPKPKAANLKPRKAAIAIVPSPKPSETEVAASVDATDKPEALSAPRQGQKDDLKKIKGVGPKLENTLNELGIYHFDQIAKWSNKEVRWVDDFLSFKGRIERDQWISQANKLK